MLVTDAQENVLKRKKKKITLLHLLLKDITNSTANRHRITGTNFNLHLKTRSQPIAVSPQFPSNYLNSKDSV